ncbi:cyclic pyranopterin phosphate synthase MoaA [Candidatus Atribacteria bacterium RBG_19FT_COMBO_35_14]|uniref:GTP 3',8-cyclase n=1 Tax=Candidatus Sediminicultor quintus TaxID=1797291 RepID=A0A1F5ACF4_9BACT|nr:MAG: cyclic pyranopterin phosphate synthase MoaA [Candidatus Atribacteria bacterium RBG_19FT_COMBO_35_14]
MNKLIDNFGREISYLRVSITDRCNYRCIYCKPEEQFEFIPHGEILRYEEIIEIIEEAVNLGVTKVRITGGEPLARKGVVDFIKKLREIKKLEDISLTTNGFFLIEYAERLKDAGLNRVNISLDSLQEEKYKKITRGGSLEKALKGIDSALKAGLWPIKINTVLIRGINDDEVEDFVRLTLGRPLNIRFIEFMPSGEELKDNYRDKFISVLEIKESLAEKYSFKPININSGNGPAKYYQVKGGQGTIGFITALSQHFCETCNRIRLTSEGKLRPCLFSNKEVDIKQAIRNAKTDDKVIRSKIIRNNIEEAINIKPEGHKLNKKFSNRDFFNMSKIGG